MRFQLRFVKLLANPPPPKVHKSNQLFRIPFMLPISTENQIPNQDKHTNDQKHWQVPS